LIKRVEINYRGIFQKNLGKKIGSDIVIIASRMGRIGFSNGRYSDSPERNGIPCKYFAFVSHDLPEEELEAECGAKLDIDQCDISVVLDDTMVKGVEPWGWHGVRPINEKVQPGGTLLVITKKSHDELLQFIAKKPYSWKLATYDGDLSFGGLWVFRDDLAHEKTLGAVAGMDSDIIGIEAVEAYLNYKNPKQPARAEAARKAYEEVARTVRTVQPGEGAEWTHEIPVLPKWFQFMEGAAVPAVKRHFELGPKGQSRNETFKRGTTKNQRPVVRFDLCTKCTLCWLECPDQCFDQTADGLYDIAFEYCTGCNKCAQICPVNECIVMVDELQFEDNSSPWQAYTADPKKYTEWAEQKKSKGRYIHPFVTGTGLEYLEGEVVPFGGKPRATPKVAGPDA